MNEFDPVSFSLSPEQRSIINDGMKVLFVEGIAQSYHGLLGAWLSIHRLALERVESGELGPSDSTDTAKRKDKIGGLSRAMGAEFPIVARVEETRDSAYAASVFSLVKIDPHTGVLFGDSASKVGYQLNDGKPFLDDNPFGIYTIDDLKVVMELAQIQSDAGIAI
jgi:hypothetical protein